MAPKTLWSLTLQSVFIVIVAFSSTQYSIGQNEISLEAVLRYEEPHPDVLVTPDGRFICKLYSRSVLKKEGSTFFIFDSKTFRLLRTIDIPKEVENPKLSENGKSLIVYQYPSKFMFFDIETGKIINEIIPKKNFKTIINVGGIKSDSIFLIKGAYSKYINIYDFRKEEPILEIGPSPGSVRTIGITAYCDNGSKVISVSDGEKVILWDAFTGQKFDEWKPSKDLNYLRMAPDSKHFAVSTGYYSSSNQTFCCAIENNKVKHISTLNSFFKDAIFDSDLKIIYIATKQWIKKYNSLTGEEINSTRILFNEIEYSLEGGEKLRQQELRNIISIPGTEFLLISDSRFVTHIFSKKTNKVVAYIYAFGSKDYALVSPDGRMDGTPGAIENLVWVRGNQKTSLSATYDQMYTPNLMSQIVENTLPENEVSLEDVVRFSPEIKITNPKTEFKTSSSSLPLTCELKENGDEIKQVRIFVNDKLVSDETRGMKSAGNTATYTVTLLPGVNSVKAVAVTKNGYQSGAAEVVVTFSGTAAESRLYVMAIGIDKYKNPAYNLNYAVADASAIVEMINSSAREIFKSVNVYTYQNEKANRTSILTGFDEIASQAQPQDAFILFYAGHGVMSEGSPEVPKDFYLVLQNITQIFGNDEMMKNQGISAAELRELSKKISAQKQVVFLDACQSGAAVETFAMRGVAEEKAILQLARSTGSYMIASTGSEQFASEFKELGHGVFTYALLQGLSCNADGTLKDKKVTIQELAAYLNDNIPALTEKYHGTVQYPKSWSKGMDFPISVCK